MDDDFVENALTHLNALFKTTAIVGMMKNQISSKFIFFSSYVIHFMKYESSLGAIQLSYFLYKPIESFKIKNQRQNVTVDKL